MENKEIEKVISRFVNDLVLGSIEVLSSRFYLGRSESMGELVFSIEDGVLCLYEKRESYRF